MAGQTVLLPSKRTPLKTGLGLGLFRILWVLTAILAGWMTVDSIRLRWGWYVQVCPASSGMGCPDFFQLLTNEAVGLTGLGLNPGFYRIYMIGLDSLLAAAFYFVSVLIFTRKSSDWIGLFVSFVLLTSGASFMTDSIRTTPAAWGWSVPTMAMAGTGYVMLFFLFPDGRFVPRWFALPAAAYLMFSAGQLFLHWQFPRWLETYSTILLYLTALYSQVYRYRKTMNTMKRNQIRWFVLGMVLIVPYGIWNELFVTNRGIVNMLSTTAFFTVANLLVPISIGLAIFKYKLWDIRIILNRAVLYTMLSLSVAAIYVVVVGALGNLLQLQGNIVLSWIATGLIAFLFQPIRERLQQAVNRMMYGEVDDPYSILSRLGQKLEETLPNQEVLPAIVETVAQALRLPFAAVSIQDGEVHTVAASFGSESYNVVHIPIVYRSEEVGRLLISTRGPEETFQPQELRLLNDLARQIGGVAYSTRLTMDLVRSRERLVSAREEERRRLRRDLHDGMGPALAGLTLKFGVVQKLLLSNPDGAKELLDNMQNQLQNVIADVRRLVYALRPPALDELGILFAIRQLGSQYQESAVHITVTGPEPMPPLPAAVEVAAFRITQEAIHNVVRHAEAGTCCVRLWLEREYLHVEIIDDGKGVGPNPVAGIGLHSMKERAEELGGRVSVETKGEKGTRVHAILPLHQRM